MARLANKLSARKAETLKEPGRYSDGNGLYLRITPDSKRWTFMYAWSGKRVEIGLGSYRDVSLGAAREKARASREMIGRNVDPREAPKAGVDPAPVKIPTFGEVADDFIERKEGGWKNEKHRDQWRMTLSRRRDKKGNLTKDGYCGSLVDIPVNEVSTDDILKVLNPIWLKKPETARRVRGRIEAVLNAATVLKHRSGVNPAYWRGNLDLLLPSSEKLSRGHHAAMPYDDVPAFYQKIVANPSISNYALAFTILTAARSGETFGAAWSEIDRDARLWTIPPERMKAGNEHTVPLDDDAMAVLEAMEKHKQDGGGLVFPSTKGGPLSVMAMAMALRRAEAGEFTVHGFRSSFRDWCGDETSFQRDDVEACLAHKVRDQTERAYRRGDALKKRREIMKAWAAHLTAKSADNVIRPEWSHQG